MAWWGDHRNIHREFAMMEYLKICSRLETYGVSYFEIRNTRVQNLSSVDALGLSVYERSNKVTAKPVDRGSTHFVFYASDVSVNKRILSLCMGNHELYMRRRKPLPVEMQQLKQQADEEKMQRQVEQERLIRETEARESAEKKQREYEEEMLRMKLEMDKMQHQLEQDSIITIAQASHRPVEENQAVFHAKPDQSPMSPLLYVALNPDQSAEKGAVHSKPVVSPKYTPEHKEQNSVQLNDHKPGSAGKEREQIKSAEKSKDVKNKLEILTKELEMVKETDRMEDIDKQHLENKKAGRDKYKTFRQIRSGNTKRRIDQYENM
uniref:FERM C-terminal PH-like domain-containing protein n=1 Tax=Ditylenchus dipsaci TaxID=166011 RepID=A0A915ERX6_9BILA